jgi:nitroimidazol reductase NimA-like FMN-containing flavoprotein (pyridoxamine 5'-phosphate oxidase superfamily)
MTYQEDKNRILETYQVKRIAERAAYTRATVDGIIDASYLCHISFVQDEQATTIPMACWREGDYLYFHAASKGRLDRLLPGRQVCISLALFDGLVLGHSPFNHSYNFRSVVIHGEVEAIQDEEHKLCSMQAFMDHVLPGRGEQVRRVSPKELRAICLMRVKLDQAVGKIRDEYPDEETDTPDWPVWIGVLPARLHFDAPDPDPFRNQQPAAPENLCCYSGIDTFLPSYPYKK